MKKILRKVLGVKQKQMIGYHRYPLNSLRKLPNFIIIGAQKAATSTLHEYLALHTNVQKPPIKETLFFSANYDRGVNYYKSIFPIHKKGKLTFESTPDYLSHPNAPNLCHKLLPDVKLLVILRNPVDRAFSHFNFVKAYGGEDASMTFETGLELESERIHNAMNIINHDRYHASLMLSRYSYKRNSEYAGHIKNWLKYYKKENFLFIDFNELKKQPNKVLNAIYAFIGIEHESIEDSIVANKSSYSNSINKDTKEVLSGHFKKHNLELFNLINHQFDWKAD